MTFLNASLLAGLLAAAIPIVVHLMSRRQPRRVVFPATRFLKNQLESSRSRLRVQRWWLLALRILAVVAFAVALARPQIETAMSSRWLSIGLLAVLGAVLLAMAAVAVVRGLAPGLRYGLTAAGVLTLLAALIASGVSAASSTPVSVTDQSPVALAIVIDNSIRSGRLQTGTSSDIAPVDGQPARVIDVAREHATWMLSRYPSDSRFAIIDRSPRPAAFTLDVASANRQIEKTEPLALTRPLTERIDAAVRLVRSSELPRRMVMVITDLTQQSFAEQQWQDAQIAELLAQDPPIRLQILDVGSPAAGNRQLGQLTLSDPSPPRLTPSAISTVISVDGPQPPESNTVTVEMQLYDTAADSAAGLPVIRDSQTVLPPLRSVDRMTVNLSSTATRVVLSVPPLELGTHHGHVQILGEDELPIDDRRYFTLQVRPAVSILIVAADRDSADVIGSALTAPLAPTDPLAEYQIEVSEWLPNDRQAYHRYAVILLVDPDAPSPAATADLQAYLEHGGNLISLLGPALHGGQPATAAPPAYPAGLVRRWRVPEPGSFLEIAQPTHPAVAPFTDIAGGVPWNAFRISQYWQLTPDAGDLVIMRYAGTDHPALVQRLASGEAAEPGISRGAGGGSHLILTTPLPALVGPARAWNELFSGSDAWPAFLLLRGMVQSLVEQGRGTHNLMISDLPSIPIARSAEPANNSDTPDDSEARATAATGGSETLQDVPVQMFPPRGPAVPLRASGELVTIGNVDWPGTYWLRSPDGQTGFSINLLPGQTDLSRIDPEQLDRWLGAENYDLVRDREALREAEGRGEPTRPLYSWILMIMAAALVLEQILANRFYASSRRRAGQGGGAGRTVAGRTLREPTRPDGPNSGSLLSGAAAVGVSERYAKAPLS